MSEDAMRNAIAALQAEVSTRRDQNVALHVAWFGFPGVLTPELVANMRGELDLAKLDAERAWGRTKEMGALIVEFLRARAAAEASLKAGEESAAAADRVLDQLIEFVPVEVSDG